MALEFTDDNFQTEVLESDLPVLVDFWATWCGPCRMLAPVIDELATELEGTVRVGKVDTDSNQKVASQYNIQGIPALLLFKDGQVVGQTAGVQPKEKILQMIEPTLA